MQTKRMIYWPPFWIKVYISLSILSHLNVLWRGKDIYTGLYKDSSHQTIHSDVEMILEMSSSIFSK